MRDIAPPIGKQNLPPKTLEMPILPRYFAFRDRNSLISRAVRGDEPKSLGVNGSVLAAGEQSEKSI
jgi:hypothetical protein